MGADMTIFVAVDDDFLAARIAAAARRLVFAAPAVSKKVAVTIGECLRKADRMSITLVLDPGEDAHRLGYGDRHGLEQLQKLTQQYQVGLRSQPGWRVGVR